MNFDSVESSPGSTAVPQGSVLATQPYSKSPSPGVPYPLQPRLSSPSTPTARDLALPISPLLSPSPVQSSDDFPFTPPRNSHLNKKGSDLLLVATVPPFNHLNLGNSQSVQSTQLSKPVSSANNAVPPSVVEPLAKGKQEKPGCETALENQKRMRKRPAPLAEKPSKVASPPLPKPQNLPSISTRFSSPLTCAPSARKRRSGECLPEGRGEVGDATKRQKTSQTRLADPAVQGACKLFLSVDFGKDWMDAVYHFQNFETLHPSNQKDKLKGVNRPICVHEWIKRGRSATYRPDPKTSSTIPQDFHSWWRDLQPEWRLSKGNKGLEKDKGNGDWSRLRISGANGFLSVMAALFFWRLSLKSPDGEVDWKEALIDVCSALKCMVKTAIVN